MSKDSQDIRNQRLAILEFAQREKLAISEFIELSVSSRRSPKARQIDLLLTRLVSGDTLIVSELSRMGRSVGEIITTVDALVKQRVRFMAIKEGIRLNGTPNLQNKVMITLFGLFAEIGSWGALEQLSKSFDNCAVATHTPSIVHYHTTRRSFTSLIP